MGSGSVLMDVLLEFEERLFESQDPSDKYDR